MSIIIEQGITIEAGVTIDNGGASFTITSSDISNPQNYFNGYSSMSSAGFTSNGTQLYNGIQYDITTGLYNDITNAQTIAGFNPANAWVWHASFATGGNCLVRLGLVSGSPNFIVIAPIDETNTGWQSGNDSGPTLTGSFTFPATFTPYSPSTSIFGNNSWC